MKYHKINFSVFTTFISFAAIIILISSSVPGAASYQNWPMHMNTITNTGYTDNTPPDNTEIAWEFDTGIMRLYAPPTLYEGVAYVLGPNFSALDARSGKLLWSYPIAKAQEFELAENTNWHYWSEWASPAIHGDRVYVVSSLDNSIVCLDRTPDKSNDLGIYDPYGADHDLIWEYKIASENLFGSRSSPLIVDNVLYVGTAEGDIIALDVSTDESPTLLWSYHIGTRVDSSPAYYNDKIYIGTWDIHNKPAAYTFDINDTYFYAFDATPDDGSDDGAVDPPGSGYDIIWRAQLGGLIWSSPTMDIKSGMVYIGCSDQKLYAFDSETGEAEWSFSANGPIYSTPALHDNKIFFGTTEPGNTLYAISSAAGELIWKYEAGEKVAASPVVAGDIVYSAVMNGRINAFDEEGNGDGTTSLLWTLQLPNRVRAAPVIAHKHLFASCWDGKLYVIGKVPKVALTISAYEVLGDSRGATIEFAIVNLGEGEILASTMLIRDGGVLLNKSETGILPPNGKRYFRYTIIEPEVRDHFFKIQLNYTDSEGYDHIFYFNKTSTIEKYTIPSFVPAPGASAVILILFAVAMVIKFKMRRRN